MSLFKTVLALAVGLAGIPSVCASGWRKPDSHPAGRMFKRETDGIIYDVFEHDATNTTLEIIQDSGVCETTPGVKSYSGYLSVGTNMSMWFWFFEARHNPETAPLAMWLNGGPGSSSMIGLFKENGPCQFVNGSSEPTLNPYSWNEYANMLYVDQPIGVGLSIGDLRHVDSTVTAAPYVWKFMQAFYDAFPVYKSREYGLWTESYGGHYGPEFSEYFEIQNKAISNGTITGEKINLIALGINNGCIDPIVEYLAYIDYAFKNPWRNLINETQRDIFTDIYQTKCLPLLQKCPGETGDNEACALASQTCEDDVFGALLNVTGYPDYDPYDIRVTSGLEPPPNLYDSWLARPDIMKAIGARTEYIESSDQVFNRVAATGDIARSFLGSLSRVVQKGVNTIIWAGQADFVCSYLNAERESHMIEYSAAAEFKAAALQEFFLNGTYYGKFKSAGNLNYMQVHSAGHMVPASQPEVSLEVFKQIMQKKSLFSH